MSDVELVAFYFSNADDWPESFEVYLDELALSVGPPGPEEPAPSAAAEEPKAAPPPARLDLTGGGEVLFAHDFEDGAGAFKGGKTTSTDTYRSSRASFKATPDLNDRYFSCTIAFDQWSAGKPKAKGIFEVGKDTVLAFAYYLDGDEDLTLIGWVPAKHKNFSLTLKGAQRTWNLKQVRLLDFHVHPSGTDPRLESGDWFQEFRWLAGKPGERCTLIIDDVVFCNGPLPGDVGESLRRKFDKKRETEADPRKDGFYMTAGMVDGLAERLKESKGAEKTLAVLGDRLAASNFFLAPLAKAGGRLDPKKGYRFIPKAALAGSARSLYSYRKRDSLKRALEKYKPEVVVVLVGQNDLRKGVPADEAETEYSYICECCLEAGAVPVLFAVPVKADVRTPLGGLASAYAAAAFKTAKTLQVPMIDAHSRLNAVGKSPRRYFSSTGLRQPAYDELNALFIEVYDRLERYVFARTD